MAIKKPTLADNWKEIAKDSWSFRLMALTAILEVAGVILPLFVDSLSGFWPRFWFSVLLFGVIMLAMYTRLLYQRSLSCKS